MQQGNLTMEELLQRLAEVERQYSHIIEELTVLRMASSPSSTPTSIPAEEAQAARIEGGNEPPVSGKHYRSPVIESMLAERSTGIAPRANPQQGPTTFTGSGLGTIVVKVEATQSATGMEVTSDDHDAITGFAFLGGFGVTGGSRDGFGVLGESTNSVGVFADVSGAPIVAPLPGPVALLARGGPYDAISATSDSATGVLSVSKGGIGVHAVGGGATPFGTGPGAVGVFAEGGTGVGVWATSDSNTSVVGNSVTGIGVSGFSSSSTGVSGLSDEAAGVTGASPNQPGVLGLSRGFAGVVGQSNSGIGVAAVSSSGPALLVDGHVVVLGDAVGQAILPRGQKLVTVPTSAATTSSLILLTPLGDPRGRLWVTLAAGSFIINSSAAPTQNVTIAYLVIN